MLDNFEHLLGAAPLVADAAGRLPAAHGAGHQPGAAARARRAGVPRPAPGAARLPTRGAGAAASVEGLLGSPAVALFVRQAARVAPGFALTPETAGAVAELCRRLDGLPLAIELAAARAKLLAPQAMLDRLAGAGGRAPLAWLGGGARDLPARQQTVQNTIGWSHDLLAPAERALFRRLAVFAGGCTLAAAEAVCSGQGAGGGGGAPGAGTAAATGDGRGPPPADRLPPPDVLDGIGALVDSSLLQPEAPPAGAAEAPRFRMLETVREYALERLEASGEAAAVRARHAAHFHALALRAEARWFTGERAHWTAVLTAEHDNLRAVLRWALDGGDAELGLDTAAALQYWASVHLPRRGPALAGAPARAARRRGARAAPAPAR